MDQSGTYKADYHRKVASGIRGAGAVKYLPNARSLQFECARLLHASLLVPVLTYDSETMVWKVKERLSIRGLLCIRRMNKVPNARMRKLCRVTKRVYERINEGVLR